MPPPGAVRRSSTKLQDRQFTDIPVKGASEVIGAPNVSTESTTGSPAFGSLTSPPLSKNALNAWANRVSMNKRSPTACSAPGVPVAAAVAGVEPPPRHPVAATVKISRSVEVDAQYRDAVANMITPPDQLKEKTRFG